MKYLGSISDSKDLVNKEYVDDLIAPLYSSSETYEVGQCVIYNNKLYKCNTAITVPEVWTSAHWKEVKVSNGMADINLSMLGVPADAKSTGAAVDKISSAYVTSTINDTNNGITRKEVNGNLLLYGTATATRRICFLNGNNSARATSGTFLKTLEAGTYKIEATCSGVHPAFSIVGTYTTFGSEFTIINSDNKSTVITFDAPVMIGFLVIDNHNYGENESNGTIFSFVAEKITGKDDIARRELDKLYSLEDFVKVGNFSSNSNAQVFIYRNILPGEKYRLYVWNKIGMNDINPRFYLFDTSDNYQEITSQKLNKCNIYEVTIKENSSYLRLYANKESAAPSISFSYSLIKDTGTIVDTLYESVMSRFYYQTYKIFRKVVVCGDSYASGYFIDSHNIEHSSNSEYCWPHYMEKMSGNIYYNCSVHGKNCLTWQTDIDCLQKAQNSGKSQAYILGLGLNDEAQGTTRYVPVGVAADIGTTAETYYGGMSKIIRELADISPDAHIFVLTNPNIAYIGNTNRNAGPYNTAIRTIVQTYENTYNVHLIDLAYDYMNLFMAPSILNDINHSHFTASGYEQFAEIMAYALSDYINKHIESFMDVALIEYDE